MFTELVAEDGACDLVAHAAAAGGEEDFAAGLEFTFLKRGDPRGQEVVIAEQQRALTANLGRDQRSRKREARFRLIALPAGLDGVACRRWLGLCELLRQHALAEPTATPLIQSRRDEPDSDSVFMALLLVDIARKQSASGK